MLATHNRIFVPECLEAGFKYYIIVKSLDCQYPKTESGRKMTFFGQNFLDAFQACHIKYSINFFKCQEEIPIYRWYILHKYKYIAGCIFVYIVV